MELIAMYPDSSTVPTKRQQTGDKSEKGRNTLANGVRHGDANSIRINGLIPFCC